VTKSTPVGSADRPVNPLSFALGCGATFVARTVDRNIPHMDEMLKRAAKHKGTGFIEILQNCNVYNDLAWNVIYDRESKVQHELRLEHGKPLLFGPPDDRRSLIMEGVTPKVVRAKDVQESALWVHDETNVNAAKLLADLFAPDFRCRSACSPRSKLRSMRTSSSSRSRRPSRSAAPATSPSC